jgi:hypothetical protein
MPVLWEGYRPESPFASSVIASRAGLAVRALDGECRDLAFDYRVVARRAGYENLRLEAYAPSIEEQSDR